MRRKKNLFSLQTTTTKTPTSKKSNNSKFINPYLSNTKKPNSEGLNSKKTRNRQKFMKNVKSSKFIIKNQTEYIY